MDPAVAPPGWLARLRSRLAGSLFRSGLYRFTLGRAAPQALALVPADPWPGQAGHGTDILDSRFRLAGQVLDGDAYLWAPADATEDALANLHGFDWLRDLRALNGDAARRQGRSLVADWIAQNDRWHPLSWRPDVLGQRIANWLIAHDFLFSSADDAFRRTVFASLTRQHRHLMRVLPARLDGMALLLALKGAVFGALCLPEPRERARLGPVMALLTRELGRQILGDGGHCQRSPALQVAVLRHLIDIRTLLRSAQAAATDAADDPHLDAEPLQKIIERMVPALRFFRHGDGGLALFNGSQEGDPLMIDAVLTLADGRGRTLRSARHSGFERVLSGRLLALIDTGRPPPPGLDRASHAGTLSLEISYGRERVIVNCGAHHPATGLEAESTGPALAAAQDILAWETALRGTAAHSTLMLGEQDSARPIPGAGLAGRPRHVKVEREDADGACLIDASHDGYAGRFGFLHKRRLYVTAGGDDLRVEDRLAPAAKEGLSAAAKPAAGLPFAIRLHLHPDISAVTIQEGTAVLLRLPGRTGFRFRAGGAWLALEDSLYLGQDGDRRRSRQIVLTGTTTEDGALVRWALKREKKV